MSKAQLQLLLTAGVHSLGMCRLLSLTRAYLLPESPALDSHLGSPCLEGPPRLKCSLSAPPASRLTPLAELRLGCPPPALFLVSP